jgi:hypothetical protein
MTQPIDVSSAPVRRPSDYGQPGFEGVVFQPGMDRQNPPSSSGPGGSGGITITLSGPMFTGAPSAVIAAMLREMQYQVAAQVSADVHQNLDRSLQFPTPYYETQIMVQDRVDTWVVHDRGVAYGPWLEGTSSRNRRTRFKGYASFRRATATATQKAPAIVAKVARDWIGRLQ